MSRNITLIKAPIKKTRAQNSTIANKRIVKTAAKAANQKLKKETTQAAMTLTASASQTAAMAAVVLTVPDYWEQGKTALMQQDQVLRRIIPRYPQATLTSRGDAFTTLARSIVGQQVSVSAAQSMWNRLELALERSITAKQMLKLDMDTLRTCGLSMRKCEYLLHLAQSFSDGSIDPKVLVHMDDQAVIDKLIKLRGIGVWTAQMFLIFHLLRANVVPYDDLGLMRGISLCYFSGESITRAEVREVAANWEPWGSIATWYIWRSLDPIPVEY